MPAHYTFKLVQGIYQECWTTPNHHGGVEGCIIHGLGEHSGRYHDIVTHLLQTPACKSIWLFDFPGHGQSKGRRGDGAKGFESYVDTIGEFLSKHNRIQWLWAHSMGALALFSTLEQCQEVPSQLKALVLSAPPFEVVQQPNVLERMALPVLRKVVSSLVLPTHIRASQISSIPEQQKKYEADRLVHGKISVRVYDGLVSQTHNYLERFQAVLNKCSAKILMVHGQDDTIASVKGCQRIRERFKNDSRVSVRVYPHSRHEIHHDRDRESFLKDLIAWIST